MTGRFTDLMIDIETLGKRPGCAILEIGYCAFNRDGSAPGGYMMPISGSIFPDVDEQVSMGATIDPKTVDWWFSRPEAYEIQRQARRVPINEAQHRLNTFFTSFCAKDTLIWAKSTHFDFPILRHFFVEPWSFRMIHEMRTLQLLHPDPAPIQSTGTAHCGRDDAIAQGSWVQNHWSWFSGR